MNRPSWWRPRRRLAAVRGATIDAIAEVTSRNFRSLCLRVPTGEQLNWLTYMNLGKLGQALTAREIFDLIQDDLEQVEKKITAESVASVDAVTAIGQYLQSAGGKRLRPALLLLSAKLVGNGGPSAIQLGAVVELIHAATLVHDDVIDTAETRRGRPSTNVKWGNHTCVLAGDWLYMQAFQIALRERNFQMLDLLIGLTQMMVEGELLQLERIGRINVTEADCMELVDRKTACLFSVCARLGGLCGHTDAADAGEARRVRLEPGHGLPTGGRCSGFHVAREDARQAGGRRSARRQGDAPAGLRAGAGHARGAQAGGDDPATIAATIVCRSSGFWRCSKSTRASSG